MKRSSSKNTESGFACSRCSALVAVVDGSQTEHFDYRNEPAVKCTAAADEWKELAARAPRRQQQPKQPRRVEVKAEAKTSLPADPDIAGQIAALPTPPMLGPQPAVAVFRSELERYGAAAVVHSMLTALREWQGVAPATRAMDIGEASRVAALQRIAAPRVSG